ncbi:MAG: hypothetical protein OSB47_07025 [Pirellulaceae bacterium]|nr:hypothetical protein [Pirellulaceae bacterium]
MNQSLSCRAASARLFVLVVIGAASWSQSVWAQLPASVQLEKPSRPLAGSAVELKYHFLPGEEILSRVVHLVSMDTKIEGTAETVETRSVSMRRWKVTAVDNQGNVTFGHYIDKAKMWQKVSGRSEVRFDSESDEEPPEIYRKVAATIGTSLATITMSPQGIVLGRESAQPNFNPGIGELAIPLPGRPVQVGQKWYVPDELRISDAEGRYKRIQTRQLYLFQKIQSGVATIQVRTQVLTPIEDPKIRSKLIQRLQHGTIKFDVDAGRVRSRQMDLNERVIGFNGAASIMHYVARFTEEWSLEETSDAGRP